MKVAAKTVHLKNEMEIVLRSASPADAENFLAHLRITHAESYRNLNQSAAYWNEFSAETEAKILSDFENSPSKFMLAAYHGERIVGGLGFVGSLGEFSKRTGTLGMSIQSAYSRTGLGTEMVKMMLIQAKELGFHRVELTVRSYNTAGIRLYEKMGFQRIGLLKDAAFIDGTYVDEYSYQILI